MDQVLPFSADYFVIIITIWNNSRNTDALVPVLACQDRVLRVLQVMASQVAKCNASIAQYFILFYFTRLNTFLYSNPCISVFNLAFQQSPVEPFDSGDSRCLEVIQL